MTVHFLKEKIKNDGITQNKSLRSSVSGQGQAAAHIQKRSTLGRRHPAQAAALQRGTREQGGNGGQGPGQTVCGLIPNMHFINKARICPF